MTSEATESRDTSLSFRAGGWVLVLTALLCVAFLAWGLGSAFFGPRPIGDGDDPQSYGFDLSTTDFGDAVLVTSGNARDFLAPLDDPRTVSGREVAEINRLERGKYLVSTDRVIGVEIDGAARAYPLRLMNAHEICNDSLGGVPIAVTYSPLCDSVAVYDRRLAVGSDAGSEASPSTLARTVRLGVSGLLLDSNLLMYDRDEFGADADSAGASTLGRRSLWSQLHGRAVAGPDAVANDGAPLRLHRIPEVQLVTWELWLARRPDTTVALRDPASAQRIKEIDYRRYWIAGELLYPVAGAPTPEELAARELELMSPAVAVTIGDRTELFALPEIARLVDGQSRWSTTVADREVRFELAADRATAWIDAPGATLTHGRWFALWSFGAPQQR